MGFPTASVQAAHGGSVRLLMEYDTLVETQRKLSKFARGLGVPEAELRRILNEDWLPHIEVVKIPPRLRQVDRRAQQVSESDPDDYPAAALAALLSPCILLTHNYTDFATLGVRTQSQGVDAVLALVDLTIGPQHPTPVSAMLRELAMSEESLSGQQLGDLLDPSLRRPVAEIRAYLRANDKTLFAQVRGGGFLLGHHYTLPESSLHRQDAHVA